MKINKTKHKNWRKKCRKNRVYVYQIACTRAVNQPRMLKEVSNEYYVIVL